MAKQETGDAAIQYGNPFQDTTHRFEIDALLRRRGFRIRYRKGEEEPIWERHGDEFRQRDALRTVPNQEITEAKKKEERYYGRIGGSG